MATARRAYRNISRKATGNLRGFAPRKEGKRLEFRKKRKSEGRKSNSYEKDMGATSRWQKIYADRNKKDNERSLRNLTPAQVGFETSLEIFKSQLDQILIKRAQEKGYHNQGLDGRQLYDFVHDLASNGHALGEIIYKAIRYNRRRNREDLVKIAAWAFLLYDRDKRNETNKSEPIKEDSNA